MLDITQSLFSGIINYILPFRCLSCSEMVDSHGSFCPPCWEKLDFIARPYCIICGYKLELSVVGVMHCGRCIRNKPAYDMARSLLKFNEHSKRIVHAFKYHDKTVFAKSFAKLLCTRYYNEIKDVDFIIPVPMNRFKRLFRMYNPALILAQEISKIIKKQALPDVLIKTRWTKSQTFLSKNQREKNLANSLAFNKRHKIEGSNILLIDDVRTTGSTINKCSMLLKNAGAKSVYVITVAMT